MNTALALCLTLLGTASAVGFTRGWRRAADERRRESKQAAWRSRKRQEALALITATVTCSFPHAREALQVELSKEVDVEEAIQRALESVSGVCLGRTKSTVNGHTLDLPAYWPTSERRMHAYFAGSTGSGKTTGMVHAIKHNVDAGDGVMVVSPDHEVYREVVLPLCDRRANDVVYYAPGDPRCPIHLAPFAIEPGDDRGRCIGEVFEILRRAIGQDGFGTRTGPILANSVAVLVGRVGATPADIRRLLEDEGFRDQALEGVTDEYVLDFFRTIYPAYPKGSHLPLVNRLDELLRSTILRRALCNPAGFSMRQALNQGRIVLVDLGRADPHSVAIIGQVVLAKLQLELLRRETEPTKKRNTFYVYCDEVQTFAPLNVTSFSELCSRGRKQGCALTFANQFPSQLPPAVRDEILHNVATVIAFRLGARDADVMRKELLYDAGRERGIRPVPTAALVNQPVGHAVARLSAGACAVRLRVNPPIVVPGPDVGEGVRLTSWRIFGTAPEPSTTRTEVPRPAVATLTSGPRPTAPVELSAAENRFLGAVVANPGQPSAEYARALGLNGTKAALIRKSLVDRGLVKEHRVARKAQGKPALVLEPLEAARRYVAIPGANA